MNIGLFETHPGFGGGNIYQRMVSHVLEKKYHVKTFKVFPKHFPKAQRPRTISKIIYYNNINSSINIWIRNILGIAGMYGAKRRAANIAIFYHLDYDAIPNKWLSTVLDKIIWRNIKSCECVVVISKFWKKYLASKGIDNTKIIYCAYDLTKFKFDLDDVEKFKKKYSLTGKPVIYLGNCDEIKGVKDAFLSLKKKPYHLVTSGKQNVDIQARNLELSYKEYLLLLKCSSVVLTMSKFLEGWNRTAHEAMLCETPVIGSGKGGMRELLENGKQIICEDFRCLPDLVEYGIKNSMTLGRDGYDYAKKFTTERFEQEWCDLIDEVAKNRRC